MKPLTKHIAEKLIVNKNYKDVYDDETEYDVSDLTELVLERFTINDPREKKTLKGLTTAMYDECKNNLYDYINSYVNLPVHCRNVSFFANNVSAAWLPDDVRQHYNVKEYNSFHYAHARRIYYKSDNFTLYGVYDNSNESLELMFWREKHNFKYFCDILL